MAEEHVPVAEQVAGAEPYVAVAEQGVVALGDLGVRILNIPAVADADDPGEQVSAGSAEHNVAEWTAADLFSETDDVPDYYLSHSHVCCCYRMGNAADCDSLMELRLVVLPAFFRIHVEYVLPAGS